MWLLVFTVDFDNNKKKTTTRICPSAFTNVITKDRWREFLVQKKYMLKRCLVISTRYRWRKIQNIGDKIKSDDVFWNHFFFLEYFVMCHRNRHICYHFNTLHIFTFRVVSSFDFILAVAQLIRSLSCGWLRRELRSTKSTWF